MQNSMVTLIGIFKHATVHMDANPLLHQKAITMQRRISTTRSSAAFHSSFADPDSNARLRFNWVSAVAAYDSASPAVFFTVNPLSNDFSRFRTELLKDQPPVEPFPLSFLDLKSTSATAFSEYASSLNRRLDIVSRIWSPRFLHLCH